MTRTVRAMAFYLFIGIPLVLVLIAGLDAKAFAVFDAIFWRAAAVVCLFLLWRGVLALEALTTAKSRESGWTP